MAKYDDVVNQIRHDISVGAIDNLYGYLLEKDWFVGLVEYISDVPNEEKENEWYDIGYREGKDVGYQEGWDDAKWEADAALDNAVDGAFERGYAEGYKEGKKEAEGKAG